MVWREGIRRRGSLVGGNHKDMLWGGVGGRPAKQASGARRRSARQCNAWRRAEERPPGRRPCQP